MSPRLSSERCPADVRRHLQCTSACPLSAKRTSRYSFDHLGSGREQFGRHVESERLGGLEIDDKLEFGRLLYRTSKVLSNNFLNCDFSHNAYQRNRLNVPLAGVTRVG